MQIAYIFRGTLEGIVNKTAYTSELKHNGKNTSEFLYKLLPLWNLCNVKYDNDTSTITLTKLI